MSQLIESIKLLDGNFHNLFYHERRMIRSLEELYGSEDDFHLEKFLNTVEAPKKGLYKCRIVYDDNTRDVEFIPYSPKSIKTLRIVHHNGISYAFKYANRKTIDKLFEKREGCDDILIIKNGKVTDSSFSNIVFKNGKDWITPWHPLLAGTMRQKLIEMNKITPEKILEEDIKSFQSFKLINAMMEFDGPEIEVSNIVS
jgi:4-amino-4-deoxychorismate lyase